MARKPTRIQGGFVATLLAAAAVGALGGADAGEGGEGSERTPPFVFASGYGADVDTSVSAPERRPAGGKARAVSRCLNAAADRYEGEVSLAQVNRAWEGREGWIVDISLDVAREGKRTRRRDVACRQSVHGLQVARY